MSKIIICKTCNGKLCHECTDECLKKSVERIARMEEPDKSTFLTSYGFEEVEEEKSYTIKELKELNSVWTAPAEIGESSVPWSAYEFLNWLHERENKEADIENWDTEAVNPNRPSNKVKVKIKKSK